MGEKIGAKTIDLEWVQVHPTGLVKPDDADAKIKFLAAEALRGVGGLILNKEGKRFANEFLLTHSASVNFPGLKPDGSDVFGSELSSISWL